IPPGTAAFHTNLKQALASSFRVATAQWQAEPACPGVVHPIGVNAVSLEVGNSCVDRMVLANTFIQTRPGQFLQNVGCCAAAVDQDHFPAVQPFTCRGRGSSIGTLTRSSDTLTEQASAGTS